MAGDCASCRAGCSDAEFESTACTPASNRACSLCSALSCPTGQHRAGCGSGDPPGEGACLACRAACSATEYEAVPCTASSDRECSPCDARERPPGTHLVGCGLGLPGEFLACRAECAATEFETQGCGVFSDRACAACAEQPCSPGAYLAGCGSGLAGNCSACTNCNATQFESARCTTAHDRACGECSGHACGAGDVRVGCGRAFPGFCVDATQEGCGFGASWDDVVGNVTRARAAGNASAYSTGGLGKRMQVGRYGSWVCDHLYTQDEAGAECGAAAGNASDACPWQQSNCTVSGAMCFVYDEIERRFLPWGQREKLGL